MLRKLALICLAAVFAVGLITTAARADIVTESVIYDIGGQPYEGYFARNGGFGDSQPIVMLIHDWNGIDAYEQRRTEMLAERGYAAFAADLYGQGVRPSTVEESQAESSKLYQDRTALRQRLFAGLAQA